MRVLSLSKMMTHARLGALNVAWWREAPNLKEMELLTQNIARTKPFFVNIGKRRRRAR